MLEADVILMGNSLGKRILLLFGLLFLGCVFFTNTVGWLFLKTHLLREGEIRFRLLVKEIEDILEETRFNLELSKLRGFANPLEIKILEKERTLQEIADLAKRSEVRFLILENGRYLAGDSDLIPQDVPQNLFQKLSFKPFSWEIYLAIDEKHFWREISRVLNLYFGILLVLILASLLVVYLFYRRWVRTPFEVISSHLNRRLPLPQTGIRELDSLCEHINQALKKEKDWQRKLAFTEKMSALGVLAGGYAHEFNNLLQVIAGHLKLAQIWCERGEKEKALSRLKEAEKATLRGAEISRRILRLSRKEVSSQEGEQSPLDKVLIHTLEALKRAFPKNIRVSYEAEKDLFVPLSDDALQEIILNLALNAKDAMGEEGELSVKAFKEGKNAVLLVEDTGPGIEEELKTRIFEPFFTTKGVGKGTGLGLYLVHRLVTEAGGKIEINRSKSGGASFKIILPLMPPPGPSQKEEKRTLSPPKKLKILVVDDEEEILKNVKDYLEVLGFEVQTALSAEEALKLLEKDSFNVLLVDLIMPGKNGDWLVQKVGPARGVKVVLMTGFAGEVQDKIQELLKKGLVTKVLRKPFQIESLKELLQKIDAS